MYCIPSEHIKAAVIDWLISQYDDAIIGNEVMYGTKRKVVDLLAIIKGKTIAIEIKSASDNLNRLPEQIREYKKIFDKVIIITSPSHIENVKKIIHDGTGLFVFSTSLKKILPARLNHDKDKQEMLYSISSVYLKKEYPQYKNLNSDEIRQLLSKKSKNAIHQLLVSFYIHRMFGRFKLFMEDRGEHTLVDDIPILSSFTIIDVS